MDLELDGEMHVALFLRETVVFAVLALPLIL